MLCAAYEISEYAELSLFSAAVFLVNECRINLLRNECHLCFIDTKCSLKVNSLNLAMIACEIGGGMLHFHFLLKFATNRHCIIRFKLKLAIIKL